jgi:hypothetical protein
MQRLVGSQQFAAVVHLSWTLAHWLDGVLVQVSAPVAPLGSQ